jgi:hypothetical protein
MARTGVLSDLAIKQAYPDRFPLDIGSELDNQTIALPTHPFKGSKKNIKKKQIARYPYYDFNNRATIISPMRQPETYFDLTMQYRKKLNSSNVPNNLEFGYRDRLQQGYEPIHTSLPTKEQIMNAMNNNSSTIHLKKEPHPVVEKFNERNPNHINLVSNRIKHTLYNMAEESDIDYLLQVGSKGAKINDEQFKINLMQHYDGDDEAVATIQDAFNAAKIDHKIY